MPKYILAKPCLIGITGTSTLHEWTATSSSVSGVVEAESANNVLQTVSAATIECDAATLDGDQATMNKKMREALDAGSHPAITFVLSEATVGEVFVQATGVLTVAGVSREIPVSAVIDYGDDDTLKLTGSFSVKMSDFDISPPTAIFGTLKAGNPVDIAFILSLRSDAK